MMSDDVSDGAEPSTSSNSSEATGSENGLQGTSYNTLMEKYSFQQKQLEDLEEQNAEYREKLLKTIKERDLNDELLKGVRDETKKEADELKRKLRDAEVQLKAVQDKASAQEAHYQVTTRELSLKYNNSVGTLTKKADMAEREKNEAVVKYATREMEIMKMKAEVVKKEQELKEERAAKKELETNQSADNIEQLEKTVSTLRVDLEKLKHEKFDLENRLKMSEKRMEAGQTAVTELKQQCDVLRKQLIQAKDERSQLAEENRQLALRTQQQENRLQVETDTMTKSCSDMELRLKDTTSDATRLKEENHELHSRMEEMGRENLDLLTKLQDLEDKLQLEEEAHLEAQKVADRCRDIESKVERSRRQAETSKQGEEEALKDKELAEKEAEACRLQAERMLQITEQLTQRNSQLAIEAEQVREKNRRLEHNLVESQGALSRATSRLQDKEKDLTDAQGSCEEENTKLKEELRTSIGREKDLAGRLSETRNDFAAYKKKQASNVKELKHELATLRRQVDSGQSDSYLSVASVDAVPSTCSRSRTSSLTSLDRVTSGSQEESSSVAAKAVDEVSPSMQQAMVDKIVLLQRKLARRTEKIEFLEEHVRQCLEELQKKTKLIQHYALREEASLLLPSESSMEQVPVLKKGTSYALMGSMFSTTDKKSLQLVTEINSRLQAVLEDQMLKNMTLKTSLDSLSAEVSRLSRENRLLSLTQNKDSS